MRRLLPYVEHELALLRDYAREFARQYPTLAPALGLHGNICEDPHVERWIEATALLNARTSMRLDAEYPQFTEALLNANYPHYLRPFPACSIARVDHTAHATQLAEKPLVIPRGAILNAVEHKGVVCRFRTVYDSVVLPLAVTEAVFRPMIDAPASIVLPAGAMTSISLTVEGPSPASLQALGQRPLRLYIDGPQPFCATLRDTLFMRSMAAYLQVDGGPTWRRLDQMPLRPVGLADDEALLPFPAASHPAYRILSEYFAFPEKFDFVDLDLTMLAPLVPAGASRLTLHLMITGIRAGSDMARVLASLSARNLATACTPVVNLFPQRAAPIALTHQRVEYPLMADASRPAAYEVYSIDDVRVVRETPHGSTITEFHPYYSLRHGKAGRRGHYWVARRDEALALAQAGHELQLSLVDIDLDPTSIELATVSVALTCTNRNLPHDLPWGAPGGDLTPELPAGGYPIRFLRRPSATLRFSSEAHWRLIAHLSLNHRSLADLESFKEMLTLYDIADSQVTQRLIAGLTGLSQKQARAWIDDEQGGALVHGIEVQLTVDEDAFVGVSLHAFAQVIEHFLGLYVHVNSFAQLVVISKQTGKDLIRCQPRIGALSLL
ncbi:type VI secretion system baseplate subunit TssF [Massilia horti]|uniref:Type VI secretion system baseplate subunit TssF n=1 Tax=Massilia horti TaxID=2562153 RepID=A0A4Y9SZ84_9BURK|nr:type VI secretion system baseplate subunit TssF [Massilia horti]TFW31772.1 type VI secretion system baseplate subunit TssF [Massilia horti]